jgi:hypothetical protein
MILEANGKAFELKLKSLNVAVKLKLKNKGVGANTSASDTVNQGTKPKVLRISGLALFEDESHLKELVKIAEALNDDLTRVVYTIDDKTANVGDIREVIFNGDFDYKRMAKHEAWNVNFSLLQFNTVAEAKEARKAEQTSPVADSITGTAISAPTESEESAVTETHGFIWDTMKMLETLLEPEK